MQYVVNWRYYSSICDRHGLGTLQPGAVVDLAPEVAAAINGDSPGVLAPLQKSEARAAAPASNRMARGGRNRAAA